ncbi:MAG: hypothetical protein P8N40_06070 [Gammaproteobacteria bacterium]|nr:hypothetical protein [Gammaproteobacteria bacterium]
MNSLLKFLSKILILSILANSKSLFATTVLKMDIDQIAIKAELVFEGEVLLRESRREPNSGIINTYVTFSILEVIKGSYGANTIELKFAGGSIGNEVVEVNGLLIPVEGEQGIYFVESINRNLITPLIGWSQGHFIVQEQNGRRIVYTVDNRPVTDIQSVSSIPPTIKKLSSVIKSDSDVAAGVLVGENQEVITLEEPLLVEELKSRVLEMIK